MNFSFSDINRTESAKKHDQEILDKIHPKPSILDAEKICSSFIDHALESPLTELSFNKTSEKNSPTKR
jgi:hypothetical protein